MWHALTNEGTAIAFLPLIAFALLLAIVFALAGQTSNDGDGK